MRGKQAIDPEDAHAHRTDDGEHHGHSGISHAPQRPGEEIHEATQEIGKGGVGQDLHAAGNDVLLGAVNAQDLRPQQIDAAAQNKGDCDRKDDAVDEHPIHALEFFHAIVLAGEAHARLCDRIY